MVRRQGPGLHVEEAQRHYRCCSLCEHRCLVNRQDGQLGQCKANASAHVFRHRIEVGEELEIIPSHLFYLSGCDLRCAFCIAGANAFNPNTGVELTAEYFETAVRWGQARGACNLQWVGGEPTIHLPKVLEVMDGCQGLPPVIWKSDFFGTPEAFALLDGWVEMYIADFKFGNDGCARQIAGVDGYVEVITRNLKIAAAQGNLIVRHLLLPGHFDCCYRPIVSWMKEHLPGAKFSIRDGYKPSWRAKRMAGLDTFLDTSVAEDARRLATAERLHLVH